MAYLRMLPEAELERRMYYHYKISTFHLFISYKTAYDIIRRDKLLNAMKEFEISNKRVTLIRATLKTVRCRVKLQDLSNPFFT
jgi:sorting nexin-29